MKLCLIGSTRFMEKYVEVNRRLTLMGHIVYTVAAITTESAMKPTSESPISEEDKIILDLVHLRKIAESDSVVLVTDETDYVGFSTRRELVWAQMLNKNIWHCEEIDSWWFEKFQPPEALIRGIRQQINYRKPIENAGGTE